MPEDICRFWSIWSQILNDTESVQEKEIMFALTFLTPNPRLPPCSSLVAKSIPESALNRRSSISYSSNSLSWRPKLRFNGFKLKSAMEGGDLEPATLVKGLKLGGMFGVWYLLNIYYNIFNKQVPSLLPSKYKYEIGFWFLKMGFCLLSCVTVKYNFQLFKVQVSDFFLHQCLLKLFVHPGT